MMCGLLYICIKFEVISEDGDINWRLKLIHMDHGMLWMSC